MKLHYLLLALLLTLAACAPVELLTTPTSEPSTVEPTVVPTATAEPSTPTSEPTATDVSTPTPEPTAPPNAEVWNIWFRGFECQSQTTCEIDPDTKIKYYVISTDGINLNELSEEPQIYGWEKPAADLPDQLGGDPLPEISPDGITSLYVTNNRMGAGLYKVDLQTKQTVQLLAPENFSGPQILFGLACCVAIMGWASDSSAVEVVDHRFDERLTVLAVLEPRANIATELAFDD